jgi:hypothetical protein
MTRARDGDQLVKRLDDSNVVLDDVLVVAARSAAAL